MEQSEKTNRITGKSLFLQQPEDFLSLQEQAQAGDVTAQYIVGICHLYGQNTKVDFNLYTGNQQIHDLFTFN